MGNIKSSPLQLYKALDIVSTNKLVGVPKESQKVRTEPYLSNVEFKEISVTSAVSREVPLAEVYSRLKNKRFSPTP